MTDLLTEKMFPENCLNNEYDHLSSKKQRVLIIGGGAAGLVNLRLLKTRLDVFDVTVYEKSSVVGGTWVYTDEVGVDHPVHSSMYKNLLTNIPMCIMQFSDFPCKEDKTGFIHHTDVLQYLQDYAEYFDLHPFIKFGHEVTNVKRLPDNWVVTVRELDNTREEIFDSVILCHGKYSIPKTPDIQGHFDGRILHAHDYRKPEDFIGQRIVVLGAGPSGTDIALELAEEASQVYLCHSLSKSPSMGQDIIQVNSSIYSFDGSTVVMKDGSKLENIDTVLFATGYDYDFSFLDSSCQISVNDARVTDLYLHLINSRHPSMAIFAIPSKILPFPLYEQQAKFFFKYLLKEFELPSTEDMIADSEKDIQERLTQGIPLRHAHKMTFTRMLFDLEEKMAKTAGFEPIKPVVKDLFGQLAVFRQNFTNEYKKWQFRILNDTEYLCIKE